METYRVPQYIPTAGDRLLIRQFAAKAARRSGPDAIVMRPTTRINAAGYSAMNALLVSEDGLAGTDHHNAVDWGRFASGVTLTADGSALVDFYVYDREEYGCGELLTYVQAHVEGGLLVSVAASDRVWVREPVSREEQLRTLVISHVRRRLCVPTPASVGATPEELRPLVDAMIAEGVIEVGRRETPPGQSGRIARVKQAAA